MSVRQLVVLAETREGQVLVGANVPTVREEAGCFVWVVQPRLVQGYWMLPRSPDSHRPVMLCCNPSWSAGNWSRQRTAWSVGTSGWSLEWVASVEVCRRWRSCKLRRLRTTTQSLIDLETDRPVTIPTARGRRGKAVIPAQDWPS